MLPLRRIIALLLLCLMPYAARATDGDFAWARSMGGTSYDYGTDIAVDSAGNVYTTGYFDGTVDFDPGEGTFNLTSAGEMDIFVQKLDASGNLVWARGMGGASYDYGSGIAVDSAGNFYTTGQFSGTVDFDPGAGSFNLTSAGSADIFVQKLDASGNLVWARGMGGTSIDSGNGIAVDSSGNVYTTGVFKKTVDFDPGVGTFNLTSAGFEEIFVQKLDASGNLVWARGMGGTGYDLGLGIAVDSAGNVYTTGCFSGTVDFDPGAGTLNLSNAGEYDIFLQKLDASGNLVWAQGTGGVSTDRGNSIALDSAGNIYTTGSFRSTVDFDPGASTFNLTSPGWEDIFLQKLDASGNLVWARGMGGTSYDLGNGIAVDSSGNVYTTGLFQNTVDFDPGVGTFNLTSAGLEEIFVQKLDASGNLAWARGMGGTSGERGFGIAVGGAGSVYTTGRFGGTADFDPGAGTANLTSAGGYDIFVLKLAGPDRTPPNAISITPATTGPTNATSVDFTVTFDEEVQHFDAAADVVLVHSGTASTGANISAGLSVYSVTVTGVAGDGSFTLAVNTASDVQDIAGNPLATSVTSASVVIDNTAPTVSIGTPSTSLVSSIGTATYPVAVDGASNIILTSGDVTLNHSGTVGGSVNIVNETTANPTVQIAGVTGDGSYTISIAAGIASDAVGNVSLTAGPSSGAVSVDNTAPVFFNVVANPSEASEGDTVSISFESSEPIAGDPEVTVNGNAATRTAKADFAFEYIVLPGDALAAATIEISAVDGSGNTGALSDATALSVVSAEGEGAVEGAADGEGEGGDEGEGAVEGAIDGEGEGSIEGEGEGEEPPVGCSGCNPGGGPMEKSLGDWLAGFLGLAVLLGAHLSLRTRQEA